MAGNLTAEEHVERIKNAHEELILRIEYICSEALAAIQSDDPRKIEGHLEKLSHLRLGLVSKDEEFASTITYALEQLGLKPAS